MNDTNLAYRIDKTEWSLDEWDYIVSEASTVFRMTHAERNTLYYSTTARIIATIPFEAKCEEAERTAIAHICLYIAEIRGFQKYCAHNKDDDKDIFNRLLCISNFKGGNKDIIEHGMSLLALIMLEGYKETSKHDKENNIYNPVAEGIWDYRVMKNKLIWHINKIKAPVLDSLFFPIPITPGNPSGSGW